LENLALLAEQGDRKEMEKILNDEDTIKEKN